MNISFQNQKALATLHTFHLPVYCAKYCEISTVAEFVALTTSSEYKTSKKLVLGGGSNMLFKRDFDGLVIKNSITGIETVRESESETYVKAGAGENWHAFVMHCVDHGWGGLENLSLIPGQVGASPMQNIGAYGVEIKDVFEELEALDMENGKVRVFKKEECAFGYRESIFKRALKDKYLISSVTFRLSKQAKVNTSYGAIEEELKKNGILNPGIKDVSNAVIAIRKSKLPDPAVTGNAGSFFKNPEVTEEKYLQLKSVFPDLVAYALPDKKYKLAAGWLIEKAGWKGYRAGDAGVHPLQALVLVNYGTATGNEVYDLSEKILQSVKEKFGVDLEREVNII